MRKKKEFWYTKKEIMGIFGISESTYKRRVKNIVDTNMIKFVETKTGSQTMLINGSIIPDIFRRKNKRKTPSVLDESDKDSIAWGNIHALYGFTIWCDIGDKWGESFKNNVDENVEELFNELLTKIKNSDEEGDKDFIHYCYNEDSERYDKIIKSEILENVGYYIGEK